MSELEGYKVYRHAENPKEKELHDKFLKIHNREGYDDMDVIAFGCDANGNPEGRLSEKEQKIMLSTIQWLGSPVGQCFLRDCGFILREDATG